MACFSIILLLLAPRSLHLLLIITLSVLVHLALFSFLVKFLAEISPRVLYFLRSLFEVSAKLIQEISSSTTSFKPSLGAIEMIVCFSRFPILCFFTATFTVCLLLQLSRLPLIFLSCSSIHDI